MSVVGCGDVFCAVVISAQLRLLPMMHEDPGEDERHIKDDLGMLVCDMYGMYVRNHVICSYGVTAFDHLCIGPQYRVTTIEV